MARLLFSSILSTILAASAAWAHHATPGRTHPTVTIGQTVLADGKPLPAGTYELWVTDERPQVGAGAPSEAQRIVELVQNNQVVARVVAEVFPSAGGEAVGTSGSTATSRVRADMLRGGEFLRLSFSDAGGRYLIHLPTGPLNEPAPQPQAPSRIELPPQTNPAPAAGQPGNPAPQAAPPASQPAPR